MIGYNEGRKNSQLTEYEVTKELVLSNAVPDFQNQKRKKKDKSKQEVLLLFIKNNKSMNNSHQEAKCKRKQ